MRLGARWLRVCQGRSLYQGPGSGTAAPARRDGGGGAERSGPLRSAESPFMLWVSLACDIMRIYFTQTGSYTLITATSYFKQKVPHPKCKQNTQYSET